MGGRQHLRKQTKKKPDKHLAKTSVQTSKSEEYSGLKIAAPEAHFDDKKKDIEMVRKTLRKPDASDYAVWGIAIAVVAAVVYGLQWLAMIEQNKISRESSQAVQRAFLYVDSFELIPNRKESDPSKIESFTLYPQVRNSGTTPALHVVSWFNKWHSPNPIDNKFDFPDFDSNGNRISGQQDQAEGFIPPQSVQDISVPLEIPGNLAVEVGKTQHFYLYGRLGYRDVFEGTPQHTTIYCIEIKEFRQIDAHDNVPPTTQLRTQTCPNQLHNCVDDQCQNLKDN